MTGGSISSTYSLVIDIDWTCTGGSSNATAVLAPEYSTNGATWNYLSATGAPSLANSLDISAGTGCTGLTNHLVFGRGNIGNPTVTYLRFSGIGLQVFDTFTFQLLSVQFYTPFTIIPVMVALTPPGVSKTGFTPGIRTNIALASSVTYTFSWTASVCTVGTSRC